MKMRKGNQMKNGKNGEQVTASRGEERDVMSVKGREKKKDEEETQRRQEKL